MANEVIIEFKADTRGLDSALNTLEKTGQIDKKTADQIRTDNKAWKEREEAIKKSNQEQAKSADPKNQPKISSETLNSFVNFKSVLSGIGAAVGAAFATHQIIAFAKESIAAFAAAEKGQQQLLFALKNQKGVQQDLIRQANQLQRSMGIDSDVVIKAQSFLAIQGRTTEQIKRTITAAGQLSAVLGIDLQTAIEQLDGTFEGNIGKLSKLDNGFKTLTQEQLANGAAVDLINEKYKGFAESTLNTTEGKLRQNQLAIEDLKKSIGERLADSFSVAQKAGLEFFEKMLVGFNFLANPAEEKAKQLEKYLEKVKEVGESQLANKSMKELEVELTRINSIWVKNDLERAQRDKQLEVVRELIAQKRRERDDQLIASTKKYEETLDSLMKKLQKLKDDQLELTDPLGKNKKANIELLKQMDEVQKKIDEITGKTQKKSIDKTWLNLIEDELGRQNPQDVKISDKDRDANVPRDEFDDFNKKFFQMQVRADKELADKRIEDAIRLAQTIQDIQIQAGEETISALFGMYSDSLNRQVELLQQKQDEELELTDDKLTKNREAYDNELISAREFREKEKVLLDLKTKQELDAQKKINDLKRQAAVAAKVEKLFEIAINTASNVIKQPGPFGALVPYWLGLGAVQAGIVAAAPLPKYHTGRLAKGYGEELAIIQKEETIFNAKKSKEYGPTMEAIFHGKVPALELNRFVKSFNVKDFSNKNSSIVFDVDEDKIGSAVGWELRGHKTLLRGILNELKNKDRPDYRSIH